MIINKKRAATGLALLLMLFSQVAWALPHEEVEQLEQRDLDFARAERALLHTWKITPAGLKKSILEYQRNWIKTKRDEEAAALMAEGLTFAQAYTISTALRNADIIALLPPALKTQVECIDVEALFIAYWQAAQNKAVESASSQVESLPKAESEAVASELTQEGISANDRQTSAHKPEEEMATNQSAFDLILNGRLGPRVTDADSGPSAGVHLFYEENSLDILALRLEPDLIDNRRHPDSTSVTVYCREPYKNDCSVVRIDDFTSTSEAPTTDKAWTPFIPAIILGFLALIGLVWASIRRTRRV